MQLCHNHVCTVMNSNRLLLEIGNTRSQIKPNHPRQGALPKLNMQLSQFVLRNRARCVVCAVSQ